MVDIVGNGATPSDPQIYKQDLNRAVSLFQKSLTGYEQSGIPEQKEKYKDVMDKCLVVIHETLQEILKKEAQKPLNKVDQDYHNYIANDNPKTLEELQKDLDSLKNA